MRLTVLIITIVLTGLSAGLFYAWEVSVIPGTKRISDSSYLEVMQAINRAILNPAFYLSFFGSLIFLVVSSYLQYRVSLNLSFWLLLCAALSYLIGTFGVTVLGNVPLNETLDAVNLSELNLKALQEIRRSYELKWNLWHSVRTVFSVLAFILSVLAAFVGRNSNDINF